MENDDSSAQPTEADWIISGIERSAWGVLLSMVKPPPPPRKSSARKQGVTSSQGDTGIRHSVESDSSTGDTNGMPTMVSHFEMNEELATPERVPQSSSLALIDYEHLPPSQTGSSSGYGSQSSFSSETHSSPMPHEYFNYQLTPTNFPLMQFYGGSPTQVESESSFTEAHYGYEKSGPAGGPSISDPTVFSTFEQWLYPS